MPFKNLLIIFAAGAGSFLCYRKSQQDEFALELTRAMNIVKSDHVDADRITRQRLFEGAMNGMVDELDAHSSFISRDDLRRFQEGLDQEFGGVGIHVDLDEKTKRLMVRYPVIGKPGHRAGMRPGDIILEIDGTSTENLQLTEAVNLMRGKEGELVVLTVRHKGEEDPVTMRIKREIIAIDSVLGDTRKADGTWNFFLEEDPRIGYIRVESFGEHTADELTDALKFNDQPVKGLILDLRWNAGGLLKSAVSVCDLFIDESRFDGLIVTTRGRGRVVKSKFNATDEIAIEKNLPIVVLVNQDSASASEIVAACLKDHGRAIVIGERTYGKGTVQNIIDMENGHSALKITTASYWRPNEKDIHRRIKEVPYKRDDKRDWGVRPSESFEVVLTEEQEADIMKRRRLRDFGQEGEADANEEPPSPDEQEDAQPMEEAKEPAEDTQLRRAIEFLQKQLRTAQLSGARRA